MRSDPVRHHLQDYLRVRKIRQEKQQLVAKESKRGNYMDTCNPCAALGAILVSLLLITAGSAPAQAAGLPVIISTTVDYTHNTLTVNGQNFGSSPAITVDSMKFPTVSSSSTQIVGSFPAASPPTSFTPGTYFLTLQFSNQLPSIYGVVIGASGAQGPAGPSGSTGPAGAPGVNGAPGPAGPAGPQGLPGPIGPAGATGTTGPQGAQGQAGTNGANGSTGATGAAGAAGPPGPPGVAGPAGGNVPANLTNLSNNLSTTGGVAANVGNGQNHAGACANMDVGDIILSVNSYGTGAVAANGQYLSRIGDAVLFEVIGITFGDDPNGAGFLFRVPDLTAFAPAGLQYSICTEGIFP
jgi:hypothetical protein